MFDWLVIWWTVWALQALWGWYNVYNFRARLRKQGVRGDGLQITYTPPAAVIVPIRGVDEHFQDHLAALLEQDYPQYRLIFVVQDEHDPAYESLAGYPQPPHEIQIVVAGLAEHEGQKVHNQLRGLEALRDDDEVVVFADADAVPDNSWLARLVEPLWKGEQRVTSGYRWLVPGDGAMASRLLSAVNASVATLAGTDRRNHAWGGSMALRRTMLDKCRLTDYWRGALSDDYQFTRAAKQAGMRVYFVMRCMIASPATATWGRLLEFGRRQYLITRVYAPWLWLIALLGTGLYVGGWITAIAALIGGHRSWPIALGAMAMVTICDHLRAVGREKVVKEIFNAEMVEQLRPALRLERWGTPLIMAVHLLLVLSSALGRRIQWAGVRYRLRGRRRIDILGREPGR